MPGVLRPNLDCPRCGRKVMATYNEWNGSSNTHRRDYMHHGDDAEWMHCVETMPYEQGLARAQDEAARPGDPMPTDW